MDEAERERLQMVIASSDQTVDEDGGSADPVAQRRVVDALVGKARALDRLGRQEERIRVWDEMVRLFADDPPPARPLIALQAAEAKAQDLRRLDRPKMALEVVGTVVDACDQLDRTEAVVRLAARALGIKRDTLAQMGHESEASRVDDQIVGRFLDVEHPDVRGYVNRALSFKSKALWRANRVEDALEVSRLMVARVQLATTFARGSQRLGKIGAASALAFRVDALVAGDPHIARIAYDDSLHDRAITDRSMIVRLIARG